jgi:pimeloyl-ACP methyl ester carboxylesterase
MRLAKQSLFSAAAVLLAFSCSANAKQATPGATSTSGGASGGAPPTIVVQADQVAPTRTRYIVDGRQVDLVCKGRGRPPVVFQAGGRDSGSVWDNLVKALGPDVLTCVFDRPGTTFEKRSLKPPPELLTPNIIAKTLAATLEQAGLGPRVILVGHSAGGLDSLVFGANYPDLVAGAILFDPSTIPEPAERQLWTGLGFEFEPTVRQIQRVQSWPHVPLVILTSDGKKAVAANQYTEAEFRHWVDGHKRYARLSSEGTQREVPGTDHYVYVSAPKVAVATIRRVLDASSA